jgi:DnaJ-class molecular chaperone
MTDRYECPYCKGEGYEEADPLFPEVERQCEACNGTGQVNKYVVKEYEDDMNEDMYKDEL